MPQLQKAFAVGNSTVVTLPSVWGIDPGVRLRSLPKRRNLLSYEIMGPSAEPTSLYSPVQEKKEYLRRVSGAIKSTMSTKDVMSALKHYKDSPYERI